MTRGDSHRAGFIRSHTRVLPVPHAPEIHLHLAEEATELWEKTETELEEIGLPPPFWAFAWAGGQALARYLLDHPEVVRGTQVLDFASGSGLAAIAAARAGAARVTASDIDPFALAAIPLNAQINDVTVEVTGRDLIGHDDGWELVLAADVFYERDTAARVLPWLRSLSERGARVLIGDPGRTYLDRAILEPIATYEVPVTRALEDADIKRTYVWQLRSDSQLVAGLVGEIGGPRKRAFPKLTSGFRHAKRDHVADRAGILAQCGIDGRREFGPEKGFGQAR